MKPLLIIKAGSRIAGIPEEWGDFEHWIAQGAGLEDQQWTCSDVSAGASLPLPAQVSGVIVTGSPAMVTDRLPWSEQTAAWLFDAVSLQVPVLGICYGHQLLAHALGGEVGDHPAGREIGTKNVQSCVPAQDDPLFTALPRAYAAHVTHSQTVLTLPIGATVLGANDFEPHHVLRFGRRAWGVQYHPEFTPEIMRRYIELRSEVLLQEGLNVEELYEAVRPTPQAGAILRRFVTLAAQSAE